MKIIKIVAALLFSLIILIPVALFRTQAQVASEIDNRMLAENPFSAEEKAKGGDLTVKIENYVNDRIGFRDEMIMAYTLLNDRLFGKMVHPTYCYGQDGWVFFKMAEPAPFGEFHEAFADMILSIQEYCEARSVPFLFVFEPTKASVLTEYLPVGVNYDRGWVDEFFQALDQRGVRYVDNTGLLREKVDEGEMVFNQKYDAGHWNDLGAYYGVNAMLKELQLDFKEIELNDMQEFQVSKELETSLPGSTFPIEEWVPAVDIPIEDESLTKKYSDEVVRHRSHPGFGYYRNQENEANGAPKALVFQGSHMNEKGAKYLRNALGEYIYVHNYENVINFSYYFNIFQPECVIFEVAENAVSTSYFNYKAMTEVNLNPPLQTAMAQAEEVTTGILAPGMVSIEQGTQLTKLYWLGGSGEEEYVWACLGQEFDMQKNEEGIYEVTIENEVWDAYHNQLSVVAQSGGAILLLSEAVQ